MLMGCNSMSQFSDSSMSMGESHMLQFSEDSSISMSGSSMSMLMGCRSMLMSTGGLGA
jgi:hypothetical protein